MWSCLDHRSTTSRLPSWSSSRSAWSYLPQIFVGFVASDVKDGEGQKKNTGSPGLFYLFKCKDVKIAGNGFLMRSFFKLKKLKKMFGVCLLPPFESACIQGNASSRTTQQKPSFYPLPGQ